MRVFHWLRSWRLIKRFSYRGANMNACDNRQRTPLHHAAEWNRSDAIVLLIQKGADAFAGTDSTLHCSSNSKSNSMERERGRFDRASSFERELQQRAKRE